MATALLDDELWPLVEPLPQGVWWVPLLRALTNTVDASVVAFWWNCDTSLRLAGGV